MIAILITLHHSQIEYHNIKIIKKYKKQTLIFTFFKTASHYINSVANFTFFCQLFRINNLETFTLIEQKSPTKKTFLNQLLTVLHGPIHSSHKEKNVLEHRSNVHPTPSPPRFQVTNQRYSRWCLSQDFQRFNQFNHILLHTSNLNQFIIQSSAFFFINTHINLLCE